jgi:hypothetical protein
MSLHRRAFRILLTATLGAGGFAIAGQVVASADAAPAPTCGLAVAITSADTTTSPLSLSVPQHNGTGTVSSVQVSLQATTTFENSFVEDPPLVNPSPGDATLAWIGTGTSYKPPDLA